MGQAPCHAEQRAMKRQPTTRTETVGLYNITTTSRPATLEELIKRDEPLPRVREWLEAIGRAIEAIRRAPNKYAAAVLTNAQECSGALTKLHALIREIERGSACDLGTVALAIERSADLAEEWQRLLANAALEKPVKAHQRVSDASRKNNEERARESKQRMLATFATWCNAPNRKASLAGKPAAERARLYLKLRRMPDRAKRQLRAMLKAGEIK